MDERCRETLARFWNFAGLDPIDPKAQSAPQLEFDDVTINFTSSDDQEYLVVSTDCGKLTDFGANQTQPMERLLQLGFALLYDHDVLLHLDGDAIRLRAFCSYDAGEPSTLSGLLSDVAAAAQTVARLRHNVQGNARVTQEKTALDQEPVVIFQP